jgi:hypothetical protein
VWAANLYARSSGTLFTTHDRDLFLPPDPPNLLRAWDACATAGLTMWSGGEPLDAPRDLERAQAVVHRSANTSAVSDTGVQIDLTLLMAGFTFEEVWTRRRTFLIEGVPIPVARLSDIVASKAHAGRPKDRLFLAAHEDALRQLLRADEGP